MAPVDPVALVGLLVALVALVIAIQNLRIADIAARNDVLGDVRAWGGEVIDLLSEAEELCQLDPSRLPDDDLFQRRSALICRTSALWDRGRCFFHNADRELHGVQKPEAFRGLRPPILDLVALSHGLATGIDTSGAGRERRALAFLRIRREFVSTIQKATSFSDAPGTVKKYEAYLGGIEVQPLPHDIRVLANAEDKGFELTFDKSLSLDSGGPPGRLAEHQGSPT